MIDHESTEQPEEPAGEPEAVPEVVPNRAERRGRGRKAKSLAQTQGRPHQADFVGRRLFRRNAG
ncbi:hypothetical protein [Actinosynnema sp. NPDC020468]|uniref:hypothetical protein n=1 Tax=Actinosynnema sp. NPDC020468 TaxID=3154488 RepID=UPI0033DC5F60